MMIPHPLATGVALALALVAGNAAAEPFPANVPRLDLADGTQVLEVPQRTFDGRPIGSDGLLLDDIDADGTPDYAFAVPPQPGESCSGIAIVPSSVNPATDLTGADLAALPRIVDPFEYDFSVDRPVPGCNRNIGELRPTGDVDGDGVGDFVVGSLDAGVVALERVVFTRLGGGRVDVTALDGRNGFTVRDGRWAGAGDFDGDGRLDPILAPTASGPRGLRVLRGRASYPAEVRVRDLSNDALLVDVSSADGFDPRAVDVGDLDADGYDDLLLYTSVSPPGGPNGPGAIRRDVGDAALIYGAPDLSVRAPSELQLPGDTFVGGCASNPCYFAAAGDVDADGFDDLFVAVPEPVDPSPSQGPPTLRFGIAVLYGGNERLTPRATLDDFDAAGRTRIVGTDGDRFVNGTGNFDFGALGDLDGDGASDVLSGTGQVLLGTPGQRPATRALDALDGNDGFDYGTGITSSTLRGLDVNGDGLDDLVFDGRTYLPGRMTDTPTESPVTPVGPAAPGGVRVSVYSATALELFWDRASTPGLRHEISRGNEVIGTSDGTSLFLGSIDARRAATYSVIAIDRDGRRSAASTTTVGGGGGTIGTGGPAAPSGVRVSVYSATALELFWNRSAVPGLRYEVRRGNELIGTSNGTSLFLGSIDARRAATYSVIAIDRDGQRSATATATVPG